MLPVCAGGRKCAGDAGRVPPPQDSRHRAIKAAKRGDQSAEAPSLLKASQRADGTEGAASLHSEPASPGGPRSHPNARVFLTPSLLWPRREEWRLPSTLGRRLILETSVLGHIPGPSSNTK